MARLLLTLENRTSMVGSITSISPETPWDPDNRLLLNQPISAGSNVHGAINVEPTAAISKWYLLYLGFPGLATAIVRFGAQKVNGVLQPIIGGSLTGAGLLIEAMALPPAGDDRDQLTVVVSIFDARPGTPSSWTAALACVAAQQPVIVFHVVNKTTMPAWIWSVEERGLLARRPMRTLSFYLTPPVQRGSLIKPDDGQGTNLVTSTYEPVQATQPVRRVLEVQVYVGAPTGPRARPVLIWLMAAPRDKGWCFYHSETNDDRLNLIARLGVFDWGITYVIEISSSRSQPIFSPEPKPPFDPGSGL